MLLDLLDHIADLSRDAPILLLCTTRPEILEARSAWGGGKLSATTLRLQPLHPKAASACWMRSLTASRPKIRTRVIAASEGNPLFLEEMVALTRERETFAVPPQPGAVLAAPPRGPAHR